jgi:hypothetical protein
MALTSLPRKREAKKVRVGKAALVEAMGRLYEDKCIRTDSEGKGHHKRVRIVTT